MMVEGEKHEKDRAEAKRRHRAGRSPLLGSGRFLTERVDMAEYEVEAAERCRSQIVSFQCCG